MCACVYKSCVQMHMKIILLRVNTFIHGIFSSQSSSYKIARKRTCTRCKIIERQMNKQDLSIKFKQLARKREKKETASNAIPAATQTRHAARIARAVTVIVGNIKHLRLGNTDLIAANYSFSGDRWQLGVYVCMYIEEEDLFNYIYIYTRAGRSVTL